MSPERAQHLTDALRWIVLGEGAAMLLVHLWALLELYRRTGPKDILIGLALRWIGHVLLTLGVSLVVLSRIGGPLNVWSPLFLIGYSALAVATWLTRRLDDALGLPRKGPQ